MRDAVIDRVGGDRATVTAIVDEIEGDFSPGLHRATVALLGTVFGSRLRIEGPRPDPTDATLILAPTHSSNLDSIVLGVALDRIGLPPFAYAAGRHIYRHRVFAALMRRLGAFKLDPDRTDRLYLRVVQVYVNELVRRGRHLVVFPGGTRVRDGRVETKLKLGLLGAAVHVPQPIQIIPVTINYQIVLEAETLIAYHLAGRSHERIVGDELFVRGRLLDTATRLARIDQRVVVRFGDPIIPHGNGWRSRTVAQLTEAYRRDTVLFPTQIVAHALRDIGTCSRATAFEAIARYSNTPEATLDAALHAWASWHRRSPLVARGDTIAVDNADLLQYYAARFVMP